MLHMLAQVCFWARFIPYNVSVNHVQMCKECDQTGRISCYCLNCRQTVPYVWTDCQLHRERTSLVFAQEIAALMYVTKEQGYSNDT